MIIPGLGADAIAPSIAAQNRSSGGWPSVYLDACNASTRFPASSRRQSGATTYPTTPYAKTRAPMAGSARGGCSAAGAGRPRCTSADRYTTVWPWPRPQDVVVAGGFFEAAEPADDAQAADHVQEVCFFGG
ncbi:hypothetical protein PG994_014480 [Apiospora phragmitis]|uniref:Uncharacterized protein n=1 Tax=Apiospora phragmitis TaxID=2905665 RepID=A0ABR1T4G4_9PEZI